ncbi:NAD(P)-binding domain-containing protein, partial [Nocardioides plantarum]
MSSYRIAVIGGTGPQGKGLGYRFARHGHTVVLGSRAAEKAVPVATEVTERLAGVDG